MPNKRYPSLWLQCLICTGVCDEPKCCNKADKKQQIKKQDHCGLLWVLAPWNPTYGVANMDYSTSLWATGRRSIGVYWALICFSSMACFVLFTWLRLYSYRCRLSVCYVFIVWPKMFQNQDSDLSSLIKSGCSKRLRTQSKTKKKNPDQGRYYLSLS